MIDWVRLRKLVETQFNTVHITLPLLLIAWAENDKDQELSAMLEFNGMNLQSFRSILEFFKKDVNQDDKNILEDWIVNDPGSNPTGQSLLEIMVSRPDHRIVKKLLSEGLDLAGLQRQLAEKRSKSTFSKEPLLAKLNLAVKTVGSPLRQYGRDLTALAGEGLFDDYSPRPAEMEKLVTVLLKMGCGNPVLLGEAGVGKTALVELLAREVAAGRVGVSPQTRIYEIYVVKLVEGTRYRGDFESRMEEILSVVKNNKEVILFCDEAHLMFRAGSAEGGAMDMANYLKPYLASGELRLIAATTSNEFNRYLAKDEALERRFQVIHLPEPDHEVISAMVHKRAQALSRHHNIEIAKGVIDLAVELSNKYLPHKQQPSKSIDLLDTAAAMARQKCLGALSESVLLDVLSKLIGRNIDELGLGEKRSLQRLTGLLKEKIIGQDEAIDKVTAAVISKTQGLGSPESSQAFLFIGPTGVGKTELAKQLASGLYGSVKDLLLLDMAEYIEYGSINKLIGAPPGYSTGLNDEGAIIRWLQNHPRGGVLLFDEIEKAHREVHNLLLGLLDNGRIHDARGRQMDCRHCLVIMTSNASSDILNKDAIGFTSNRNFTESTEIAINDFPREFLSRFDSVICFKTLDEHSIREIIQLRLNEVVERFKCRNVTLQADFARLAEYIATNLQDKSKGARGVERSIEKLLIEPIAKALLWNEDQGVATVLIEDKFYQNGIILLQ